MSNYNYYNIIQVNCSTEQTTIDGEATVVQHGKDTVRNDTSQGSVGSVNNRDRFNAYLFPINRRIVSRVGNIYLSRPLVRHLGITLHFLRKKIFSRQE